MQQRIFSTRKPQRRAVRAAEHEAAPLFPALQARAGGDNDGDVDEVLAAIDAVLDQIAA